MTNQILHTLLRMSTPRFVFHLMFPMFFLSFFKVVDLGPYLVLLCQEEGDEAYLETYADENDGEHESDNSIHNHHIETNFPYDIQGEEFETEAAVQDEESETEPEAPKPHMHMSWSGDGGLRTDRLETEDASLQ